MSSSNSNTDSRSHSDSERIRSLLSLFDADDWKIRKTAADNLAGMGPKVLPFLREALNSRNENVHYWGLKLLKQLNIPDLEAVEILSKVYRSGGNNSRLFVIEYLKNLPIYASQQILKQALDDSSWIIRQLSIGIFESQGRDSLPYLEQLIEKGTDNQKYWAMRCLGSLLGEDAVKPLKEILNASNLRMHHLAVMALGETKSVDAIPLLIKCLSSKIWLVRKEAEEVLISFGRSRELQVKNEVMKLLNLAFNNTRTDDIRFSIIHVVASITGGDSCTFLKKILKHPNENMRYFAVKTLGEIPAAMDVELLIGMLSDSNWVVRKKAAEIIVKLGADNIPRLTVELDSRNEDVVFWSISILIELGEPGLAALKTFARNTKNKSLKLTLLDRLASQPLESTMPILMSKLSDPSWMVRQKSSDIITAWGESAIPHILKVLPETIMNQDRLYWLGTILENLGAKGQSALNDLLGTYHVNELPEIFSDSHVKRLIYRLIQTDDPEEAESDMTRETAESRAICRRLLFQAPRIKTIKTAFEIFSRNNRNSPEVTRENKHILVELIVALIMDSCEE